MKLHSQSERTEKSIVESAQRLAKGLDPRLSWIDGDDIAQDVRLRRLETGHPLGRVVQEVSRELDHITRQLPKPEVLSPDSRLRPTETAVFRRMFWRDVIKAVYTHVSRWGSQETTDSSTRTVRTLAQKFINNDTFEEIADDEGVSDTAVKSFYYKSLRRFLLPQRARLIRDYTDEDLSR